MSSALSKSHQLFLKAQEMRELATQCTDKKVGLAYEEIAREYETMAVQWERLNKATT